MADDDDVPITVLMKRKQGEGGAEGGASAPAAKKPAQQVSPKASSSAAAGGGGASAGGAGGITKSDDVLPDYWDDNVSIVILMERRAAQLKEAAKAKLETMKKANAEKEASKPPKKEKKESGSSSSGTEKKGPGGHNKAADFYETKKGQILQALLARWWYAYDWPLPEEIGKPPSGYEEMDGFPGVFVSFNLDSLGAVLDLRDKKNCPSLKNLSTRPAKELQELCLAALAKQQAELQAEEGEDAALCAVIKKKRQEIKSISAEEAEAEYKRGGNKYIFSTD